MFTKMKKGKIINRVNIRSVPGWFLSNSGIYRSGGTGEALASPKFRSLQKGKISYFWLEEGEKILSFT